MMGFEVVGAVDDCKASGMMYRHEIYVALVSVTAHV